VKPSIANTEPSWKTYLKAAAFLAPPLFLWGLACVFVFPKLKQLWADSGSLDPTMTRFMQTSDFFMSNSLVLSVGMASLLAFIEWRFAGWWSQHRRALVGTLVFLLNGAVLVLLWVMLVFAVVVGAGFAPAR
jgi:ABC-type xylose transport system permease subunit